MAKTTSKTSMDQPGDRLARLRGALAAKGLDGFFVPRSDAHQGEYVPPSEERLAWVSGFTGSAGAAIVLKGNAALFVDGRYTLQARGEVDTKLFSINRAGAKALSSWLAANLRRGGRFGYDPWLVTGRDVENLKAAVEKAGAKLVAVAANPVDRAWKDRPAPPMGGARPLAQRYAGKSAQKKRMEIAGGLAANGTDAAVLTAPESICWLLNIRGSDVEFSPLMLAFAVITRDRRVTLLVAPEKITAAVRRHLGREVAVRPLSAFGAVLDQLGAKKKTVLVPATAPAWIRNRLARAGARIRDGEDPVAAPRAVKNPTELAGIRAAHLRDGAALCRFLAWFSREAPKGGLTEMDVVEKIDGLRSENDLFQGLSFPTIAAAGPHGAIVHYRVSAKTNRPVKKGDIFLLDSGAQYLDGTTDVTRTLVVGAKPARSPGLIRERYTRVLKGHMGIASARFPAGTAGSQLDILARKSLWEAGLDYDHGTGHGVGHFLNVHEGPQRISKMAGGVALEAGMLLSNEPGYYQKGAYGIRIESLLAVVDMKKQKGKDARPMRGFEVLTLAPIDRNLIDAGLLTREERAWLNAYHARVRKLITPLVDRQTASWLKRATAKI